MSDHGQPGTQRNGDSRMNTAARITTGMLATAATAGALAAGMLATSGGFQPAHAATVAPSSLTAMMTANGTVTETVSQVNRITSPNCYRETRVEVRYYRHSRTHGWERLAAPARTTSITTHCYK